QVRAAHFGGAATAAPATPAHEVTKDVFKNVGHGGGKFGAKAGPATAAAIFESGMAEAVIGGALLRVLQRVIGLVDFLELVFRLGIAGIAVGVKLHGHLAIGAFQRCLISPLLAAENIVKVTFGQN